MKKKVIIISITCIFILFSGFCYSCAYSGKASSVLVTSINGEKDTEVVANTTGDYQSDGILTEDSSIIEQDSTNISSDSGATSSNQLQQVEQTYVYAHICGAVAKPGVYQAETGARLFEFLVQAGGLTDDAAGDYINQAQPVTDGQRIYIPNQKEIEELSVEAVLVGNQSSFSSDTNSIVSGTDSMSNTAATEEASALININTANTEELMSISGIGQAKAKSIIAYREKNGKFHTIEDLMNIPGIKEGLFDQISYMIVAN